MNNNFTQNYFTQPQSARPRYPNYYDDQWSRRYPSSWYPARPVPPSAWWRPAPKWNNAWGWFAAGFFAHHVIDRALKPIPYHYGTNVYYVNDMVYVNGVPYVSARAYYAQAAEIAARGVRQEPIVINVNVEAPVVNVDAAGETTAVVAQSQEEWMPMGTFAILKDPDAADSSVIIQLATNKSGHIAGNIVNLKTDETVPVYGAVDAETQRVAIRAEGRDEIVECGLWNLTQDTLTVLMHIGEDKTEERTFVRLTDPEQEAEEEEYVAP